VKTFVILAAISAAAFLRDTNSHAASARGGKAYAKQQYAESVKAFTRANELAPSPQGAFNLGTAQIAAGQREQGSTTLQQAIRDPQLRADALFNRGNSAFAAKSLDHAIADYIDALRANPHHAGAKRNLELALARRQAEQQSTRGGQQGGKGNKQQQQPQQPGAKPSPKPGQPDLEALLRSVQQQEQEEIRRMKARAGEGRVGW
jgi:tetratricopeptide (TPR) repeat protein